MKNLFKLFLVAFLAMSTISLFSQDYKYKEDPFDNQKVNIYDGNRNKVGHYKVDAFDNSKINVYDSYGNLVKTIKNDAFDNLKTNTYDRYGNLQGSTK